MGRTLQVVGTLLFVIFISVIALRPLVANPTVSAAVSDGVFSRQALLVAPLLLVTLLILGLRLRTRGEPTEYATAPVERESVWEQRDAMRADEGDTTWNAVESAETAENDTVARETDGDMSRSDDSGTGKRETERADSDGTHPDELRDGPEFPSILAGQGGSRERGFEIEERPPDARLRDHLEHLQAELGDDETLRTDLEAFEQVATEEDDDTIPDRCPERHCNAVWEGRTVLGIGTKRYEQLDENRVICLECETVTRVEE